MGNHNKYEALPRWKGLKEYYESPKDPKIQEDMQTLQEWSENFRKRYEGKVKVLSDIALYRAIQETFQMDNLKCRLEEYAEHRYSLNTSGVQQRTLREQVSQCVVDHDVKTEFFANELAQLSPRRLKALKIPRKYKHYIEFLLRGAEHNLPVRAEEEVKAYQKVHSKFSDQWDRIDTGLLFPWGGKKLPRSDIMDIAELSPSERTRERAMNVYRKGIEAQLYIYETDINGILELNIVRMHRRHYPSYHAEYYENDNIYNDRIPMRMVRAIEKSEILPRYYALKAELMGKDQLDPWDVRAPLPNGYQHNISWKETVNIIQTACNRFHPTFGKIAEEIFSSDVIDARPRARKYNGGGYTLEGPKDILPHLLCNFHGSLHDAATAGHEVFHAIAMQLAKKKQGIYLSATTLVIAEVMAALGEELFFDELMRRAKLEPDAKKKASLKKAVQFHKLENTMYALNRAYDFSFAVKLSKIKDTEDRDLSVQEISALYGKNMAARFGGSIRNPEALSFLWGTRAHLFSEPFYLSDYPIPNLIVHRMFDVHEQHKKKKGVSSDMPDRFVAMIEKGGTDFTDNLLKGVGIHISEVRLWERGLDRVDKMIETLKYYHEAEQSLVRKTPDNGTRPHLGHRKSQPHLCAA